MDDNQQNLNSLLEQIKILREEQLNGLTPSQSSQLNDLLARVEGILASSLPTQAESSTRSVSAQSHGSENEIAPPVTAITAQWSNQADEREIAGRYKLLQKLGEGGMGQVWMAQQSSPVKRKVALKLIKTGLDSKSVLSRFDQERQALAMMDHPNIAKVYDAGASERGTPFFVMELVNGSNLLAYCDSRRLGLEQRLALFIPICQAVQHAHQKGIIHRDLKPANILVAEVDGKPIPKVIDFGVAKATSGKLTDATLSTQMGAIVGTLEYMAPEQAGISVDDVDTRADIYSLGVILYELLTGLRPFDSHRLKKAVFAELYRIIHEEVPSKPSTRFSTADGVEDLASVRMSDPRKLAARLRGELDWIVMKCLEKQRDRRYETASSLARDLERFLASEPIEARPPSSGYLILKFLNRNKATVTAASIVLVCLVSGALVALWGWHEARSQQEIAQTALTKETEQRLEAERQRSIAELAVNAEKLARQQERERSDQVARANTVLASIFKGLNPHETEADDQPLQVKLGEQLLSVVGQLSQNSVGDALQTADLQVTLGEALYFLGYTEQAKIAVESALKTYRDTNTIATEAGMLALRDLSATFRQLGEPEKALPLAKEYLERDLQARGADDLEVAIALNELGLCHSALENWDEAISCLRDALRIRQKHLGDSHADTLNVQHNLAQAYDHSGNLDLASAAFEKLAGRSGDDNLYDELSRQQSLTDHYLVREDGRKALEVEKEVYAKRVASVGEDHPATLTSLMYLIQAYRLIEDLETAQSLGEKLVKQSVQRHGGEHPRTLQAMEFLAGIYTDRSQYAEAEALLKKVYDCLVAQKRDQEPFAAAIMSDLAFVNSASGRHAEGIELQRKAIQLQTERKGASDRMTLLYRNLLVRQLTDNKQYELAIKEAHEIVQLSQQNFGKSHPQNLKHLVNLVEAYASSNQLSKAVEFQREVLSLRAEKMGNSHPRTLESRTRLALLLDSAQHYDEAETLYRQVYQESVETLSRDDAYLLIRGRNLAIFLDEQGRSQESVQLLRDLLPRVESRYGADDPETLNTMGNLASALKNCAQFDEAIALYRERLARWVSAFGIENNRSIVARSRLAHCLDAAGKTAEAIEEFKHVIELRIKTSGLEQLPTAASQYSLAVIFNRQEKHVDAIDLLKQVIATRVKLLGEDAEETIAAKNQLALGLDDSGNPEQALPLYEEVLRYRNANLDKLDEDRLYTLKNIAYAHVKLKKWAEALRLYQELLDLYGEVHGLDDSRTYDLKASIAHTHFEAGDYAQSIKIFNEVLAWREANQGTRDPDTIHTLRFIGHCHLETGETQVAINYFLRAEKLFKELEGEKSKSLVSIYRDLGNAYEGLNEVGKALEAREKGYQLSEELSGPEDHFTIQALYGLATIYRKTGDNDKCLHCLSMLFERRQAIKDVTTLSAVLAIYGLVLLERQAWQEAEPIIRECLALREKTMPESWATSNSRAMLGASLLGQKKLDEAEPLLLRGYQELSGFYQSARNQAQKLSIRARLKETLERIGQLAQAKGSKDNLPDWEAELRELDK